MFNNINQVYKMGSTEIQTNLNELNNNKIKQTPPPLDSTSLASSII